MGDLTALIMSMDSLQLGGIGVSAVGVFCFIAYKALKSKKESISIDDEVSSIATSNDDNYTVNTQIEASQIKPRLSDVNNSIVKNSGNTSLELIESALAYDYYDGKDEALQSLNEAILREDNNKEQIRLRVIYKIYSSGNEKLQNLMDKYPSVISDEIDKVESSTKFDIFENKDLKEIEEFEDIPVLTDIVESVTEDTSDMNEKLLLEISESAEIIDKTKAIENEEDTNNFFAEFGALAKQIKQENEEDTKRKEEKPIPAPIYKETLSFDVWANYMSLSGGRMNLKNTFVHLENPWGTVAGIAELQGKINREIGVENGTQIPWAIISVLPIKEEK